MNIGGGRFVWIGFNHFEPTWRMAAHAHEVHEIILIVRGAMRVTIGGRDYSAGPGDILFYARGIVHTERAMGPDPLETYFLNFRWARYPRNAPVCTGDTHARVRIMMDWLMSGRLNPTALTPQLNHVILQSLLGEYLQLWACGSDEFVDAVRRHVRRQLAEPITLDRLADELKMSKYSFLRQFKRLAGRTPMDDIRAIRVESALALLLSTSLPLKAVAAQVGLIDAHHMSHLFQRYLGAPPGSFRHRPAGAGRGSPARP